MFELLDTTQEGNRGPSTVSKHTVSLNTISEHPPKSHAGYGNRVGETRLAELVDG